MQKTGNKIRLYFRSKHSRNHVFSSELFDRSASFAYIRRKSSDMHAPVNLKKYENLNDVLNDADSFTVCTDDSFTERELIMMQDIICASGREIYGDEKVTKLVHKIETMIMNGSYLPENKNEIIKK